MTHDTLTDEVPPTTVKDPVCSMDVDSATAKYRREYRGQVYVFCSLMCLKAFEDDPGYYLTKGPRVGLPAVTRR